MGRLRAYKHRNQRLRKIYGHGYNKYLKSEAWAELRTKALERDGFKCCLCGGRAAAVHHSNYSNTTLSVYSINSLSSVCRSCHEFIEFNKVGRKNNLTEMRRSMVYLCILNGMHGTLDRMRSLSWNICPKCFRGA
jgi:5-methylcytosine-specific restriction endonuclease McrA